MNAIADTSPEALPRIDEHRVIVSVRANRAWLVLREVVDRAFSGRISRSFAYVLRCAQTKRGGANPLRVSSTLPGWSVTDMAPGELIVLEGSHRYSRYAILFRVEEVAPGRSLVRAETRGAFPGVRGRAYRLLVITSRGHALTMSYLLRRLKQRAEHTRGASA